MTVKEVFDYLEREVAPVKLSDDFCAQFKMYDNSGIIINCGNEVSGVLFTLDLTEKAVSKAVELGYNLIVTHHPAIYGGISKFDLTANPQARAIAECIKKGISVISMHLNFDAAPNGIDYYLMCGLGGKNGKCAANPQGGGYGRVYETEPLALSELANKITERFGTQRALVYGDENKKISKIASFCGAGCDEYNISFAAKNGVDAFVSSDMKHHEILALTGMGIAVIVLTHYASENYGMHQIYLKIKDGLKTPSTYFTDKELL